MNKYMSLGITLGLVSFTAGLITTLPKETVPQTTLIILAVSLFASFLMLCVTTIQWLNAQVVQDHEQLENDIKEYEDVIASTKQNCMFSVTETFNHDLPAYITIIDDVRITKK